MLLRVTRFGDVRRRTLSWCSGNGIGYALGGWVYFVKRGDGVRILVRYLDRERTEQIEPYSKSHNHSDESDAQFGRYQSNKRKNGERDNDHHSRRGLGVMIATH